MLFIDDFSEEAVRLVENPVFSGLTTNPTILKRDRPDLTMLDAMALLEKVPGTMHFVQGSVKTTEWITLLEELIEAGKITASKFVIKLPWEPSIAAPITKELEKMGLKTCATAVYSLRQCYTALTVGVDYVAVYFDRMKRSGIDPIKRIQEMLKIGANTDNSPKILAASVKELQSAYELIAIGVDSLTLPLKLAREFIEGDFLMNDLETFEKDFRM
ncbi:transaldolase family protein [Kosmotoga pacifica]|uniref:Transaldolase n=1 Tax=Kosmotoga pacifica TaxID=1330330 RepID=A0A0G2ZE12_9BACT|nr:transaldolase family protein [Kosmotoga pacifica]AKI97048.1 transaldolase [Kosmotoga pacifica]